MKLVRIDVVYNEYLRKIDNKIQDNSLIHGKSSKPFLGCLFKVNSIEYFVPLSSYKAKHVECERV